MLDRLEAMSMLLSVVDTGSFTAASRHRGVPLATLSRKVNELEAHLGTRLLVRTTRRVALTEVGAGYVASARRILEEIDETERIAAGEFHAPRGELLMTAPVLFGRLHVLPIVAAFLASYPEINIRLLFSDRNLQFMEDHVDVAIRIGRLPDSALVATRVGAMRTVVCASPKLIAAHGEPRQPGDLANMPCVNFEVLSPGSAWWFRSGGGENIMEVPVTARLSVTTAEAAVCAATDGVGATRVLHYQCAESVRNGPLRIVLKEFEVEPIPVHLVHASGPLASKVRVFLDFARERLRERLRSL